MRKMLAHERVKLLEAVAGLAREREGVRFGIGERLSIWEELFMWLCEEEIILYEDVENLILYRESISLKRTKVCGVSLPGERVVDK